MKEFLERTDNAGNYLYTTKTGETINMETLIIAEEKDMSNTGTVKSKDIVATMTFPIEQMKMMFDGSFLMDQIDMPDLADNVISEIDMDTLVESVVDNIDMSGLANKVVDDIDMSDLVSKVLEDMDMDDLSEKVFEEFDIDKYENEILGMIKDNSDMSDEISDEITNLVEQYSVTNGCSLSKSIANCIIDTIRYDLMINASETEKVSPFEETITDQLKKFILKVIKEDTIVEAPLVATSEVAISTVEKKFSLADIYIVLRNAGNTELHTNHILEKLKAL